MPTSPTRSTITGQILGRAAIIVAFLLASTLFLFWSQEHEAKNSQELIRQVNETTIEFPARVNREGFETGDMAGYHAVVWQGGRAQKHGLFQAMVRDVDVLDALEALGAIPGNGLESASWDQRNDPRHSAPDKIISGPKITAQIRLKDNTELVPLSQILDDPGGQGFDLRLGGHRALIPEWRSGCVICLYSCPGSKVGNAAYTIRDYVDGTTRFTARSDVLPEDGSTVHLQLTLTEG